MGFLFDDPSDHNKGAADAAQGKDRSPPIPMPWESDSKHRERVETYDKGFYHTHGEQDAADHSWTKSYPTTLFVIGDEGSDRIREDAYRKGRQNEPNHSSESHSSSGADSDVESSSFVGSSDDPEDNDGYYKDYSGTSSSASPAQPQLKDGGAIGGYIGLGIVLFLLAAAFTSSDD